MTGVRIRQGVSEDAPAIMEITERGWNAAYRDILSQTTIENTLIDVDMTREQIEEEEDKIYFVAEDNSNIRGFVLGDVGGEEDVATLGSIYVDPDHWGDGIGTTLLEKFEDFCRKRGYETVELRVLAENDVGVSFYRKHGYEMIDERDMELVGETARAFEFRRQLR